MTSFQVVMAIINILAVIVAPVIAVVISQKLQEQSEKRKDKMEIFKILMTARIYGWTAESVQALNIIDIVFSDNDAVRFAWKDLNEKYHVSNPDSQDFKKIEIAQYKLLETIANALGYKDIITWETIQNPYIPDGLYQQMEAMKKSQQAYVEALEGVNKMIPKEKER